MLDRVLATVRRHPRLDGAVAGARAVHRRHVALLADAVPDSAASPSAPADASPSVPGHRSLDRRLGAGPARTRAGRPGPGRGSALARRPAQRVRGPSGAFARVLASMAAATAQQATLLAGQAEDRG